MSENAVRFRALHDGPEVLLLPNAWDVLTARAFEDAGFPAVGTTSFGEGCARPGRPGVYARVADDTLRPWIIQTAVIALVATVAVVAIGRLAPRAD